jgi:hypothetical protein
MREKTRSDRASGKHPFLKGFVFSAVLLLIVLWLLPIRYEVNDEFGIIMMLSGRHGVRPDPHSCFFFSQALYYVLHVLYEHHPSFPWLGMFMYLAVYLASSLTMALIFRSDERKYAMLALPALVLFFGYCFAFLSATATSLLLEFAVFLCLMEWTMERSCPVRHPRLYGLFLAFCFLLSYIFRWRLVLYSLFLGVPVLFFARKEQCVKAVPFFAALAIFITADRTFFYYTTTDEHRAFAEYTAVRSDFNDTIKGERHGAITLQALRKVGWTFDDYAFFRRWILYDEILFNVDTLRTFVEANDPQDKVSAFDLAVERIAGSIHVGGRYTLVLALSVVSLLCYRWHGLLGLSLHDRAKVFCSLGLIVAAIVFYMYYRFQPRVFVPLYLYLVGASFVVMQTGKKPNQGWTRPPVSRRIAVVFAVLLMLLTLGQVHAQGRILLWYLNTSQTLKDYVQRCIDEASSESISVDPLLVLMDPISGLGFEAVHPLKELSDFPDVRIFLAGTKINSPAYFDALQKLGLKGGRDFLKWLIDNEDVSLVLMPRKKGHVELIIYLWESYFRRRVMPGRAVRIVPVHDFRDRSGAGLAFYSIVTVD